MFAKFTISINLVSKFQVINTELDLTNTEAKF